MFAFEVTASAMEAISREVKQWCRSVVISIILEPRGEVVPPTPAATHAEFTTVGSFWGPAGS